MSLDSGLKRKRPPHVDGYEQFQGDSMASTSDEFQRYYYGSTSDESGRSDDCVDGSDLFEADHGHSAYENSGPSPTPEMDRGRPFQENRIILEQGGNYRTNFPGQSPYSQTGRTPHSGGAPYNRRGLILYNIYGFYMEFKDNPPTQGSSSSRSSGDASKARRPPTSPKRSGEFRNAGCLLPLYLSPILIEGSKTSRCVYCVLLQLLMWACNAAPKAVTGMLPLVDGPLLGVMAGRSVAPEYLSESVLSLALTLLLLSAVERDTDLVPRLSLTLCARFGLRRRALFALVCSAAFLGAMVASSVALALPLMWITDRVLEFLHAEQLDRVLRARVRDRTPSSDTRPTRKSVDTLTAVSFQDSDKLFERLSKAMKRIPHPRRREQRRKASSPVSAAASAASEGSSRRVTTWSSDSRPSTRPLMLKGADGYVVRRVKVPGESFPRGRSHDGMEDLAAMLLGCRARCRPAQSDANCTTPSFHSAATHSLHSLGDKTSSRAAHDWSTCTEGVSRTDQPVQEQGDLSAASTSPRQPAAPAPKQTRRRPSLPSVGGKGTRQQPSRRRHSMVDFGQTSVLTIGDANGETTLMEAGGSATRTYSRLATGNAFGPPRRKSPWEQGFLRERDVKARKESVDSLSAICSTLAQASSIGQYQAKQDIARRKKAVDRKHAAIRSAFLLAVAIVTALGSIASLGRLPTRKPLAKALASAGERMGLLHWGLIATPGSLVAFLLCCFYFYTNNLLPYEPKNSEENSTVQMAARARLILLETSTSMQPRQQRWSQTNFLKISASAYLAFFLLAIVFDFLALELSFLAVLNVVATSLPHLNLRPPEKPLSEGRSASVPWDIVFIAGGAQAISRFTSEYDLVGGVVRALSPHLWQQRSAVLNQALLSAAACLLAEVGTVDMLAEDLLPLANIVAMHTDQQAHFYAVPLALCASTNLMLPMSLPVIFVHGLRELDLTQLLVVGIVVKTVLVACILLSLNTTGHLLSHLAEASSDGRVVQTAPSVGPAANRSSLFN
ncbi:uncharacterized protein LOC144119613 [Amblyomma americanum]